MLAPTSVGRWQDRSIRCHRVAAGAGGAAGLSRERADRRWRVLQARNAELTTGDANLGVQLAIALSLLERRGLVRPARRSASGSADQRPDQSARRARGQKPETGATQRAERASCGFESV